MDCKFCIFSDSLDKKNVTWWEYLLYEKRVRIAYVFILGVLLGIVIPVIIFATKLENKEKPIYGSCLIKENARWETDKLLIFSYHSKKNSTFHFKYKFLNYCTDLNVSSTQNLQSPRKNASVLYAVGKIRMT